MWGHVAKRALLFTDTEPLRQCDLAVEIPSDVPAAAAALATLRQEPLPRLNDR